MHTHYECVNQHSILSLWGCNVCSEACGTGWKKKKREKQNI